MSQQPSVSFYALSLPIDRQADPDSVVLFACRLAEKAHQLNHRVHLHAASAEQANRLDDLLWQFRSESFLPHVNIDEIQGGSVNLVTITIGTGDKTPANPEVLINLADTIWDCHTEFNDIREIVSADDSGRDYGRKRYRYYKNQGYNIETMKL